MVEENKTTIEISRDIYSWLESKKIHPRQSFNEVLENIKEDENHVRRCLNEQY